MNNNYIIHNTSKTIDIVLVNSIIYNKRISKYVKVCTNNFICFIFWLLIIFASRMLIIVVDITIAMATGQIARVHVASSNNWLLKLTNTITIIGYMTYTLSQISRSKSFFTCICTLYIYM